MHGKFNYEALATRLLYLRMYILNLAWLQCSTEEPQLLQYFKMVFLDIQNATICSVFVNPVTYNYVCMCKV